MAKSTYIRVFANQNQDKCLDAAELILAKVPEIKPKHLYFPEKPNENGYYAVLVRVPEGMSELRCKARCSWALGE